MNSEYSRGEWRCLVWRNDGFTHYLISYCELFVENRTIFSPSNFKTSKRFWEFSKFFGSFGFLSCPSRHICRVSFDGEIARRLWLLSAKTSSHYSGSWCRRMTLRSYDVMIWNTPTWHWWHHHIRKRLLANISVRCRHPTYVLLSPAWAFNAGRICRNNIMQGS